MKKPFVFTFLTAILFSSNLFAQVPHLVNYQAIVRDAEGMPLTDREVSLRLSVLGNSSGEVFSEEHLNLNTGNSGLINLKVGAGDPISGSLEDIDWGADTYVLNIEIDIEGGTNYSLLGQQQLVSVPYALFSQHAANVDDADADTLNEIQALALDGDTLSIENSNFVLLPPNHDNDSTNELQSWTTLPDIPAGFADNIDDVHDADADSLNEIQALALSGDTLSIENANFVLLPPNLDNDSTNELQVLSILDDTLQLSNGNFVVLPADKNWGVDSTHIFNLNTGNVGIHNDNPEYELDVNGNSNLTGLPHKNKVPIVIVVPGGPHSIQQGIEALPMEGGTVYIKSGTYILNEGIHINKSNVTISGEQGVKVQLADGVNQPVFLLGTDVETPGVGDTLFNITIRDLEIDGNKSGQSSELDPTRIWIRNNGIDVRMVKNLWVENVNIHDARSGGLVVSWYSSKVFISNSQFTRNFFDGVALYTSSGIQLSNNIYSKNLAAGISIDNDLFEVSFNGGMVKDNGKVGIFIRDSKDISFFNLLVQRNGEDGCFAANAQQSNTGVERLFFQACSFLDNARYGFWMASPVVLSPKNTIIGCLFGGNVNTGSEPSCSGIHLTAGAMLHLSGNVCQ